MFVWHKTWPLSWSLSRTAWRQSRITCLQEVDKAVSAVSLTAIPDMTDLQRQLCDRSRSRTVHSFEVSRDWQNELALQIEIHRIPTFTPHSSEVVSWCCWPTNMEQSSFLKEYRQPGFAICCLVVECHREQGRVAPRSVSYGQTLPLVSAFAAWHCNCHRHWKDSPTYSLDDKIS